MAQVCSDAVRRVAVWPVFGLALAGLLAPGHARGQAVEVPGRPTGGILAPDVGSMGVPVLPSGGVVTAGAASIASAGSTLTVTQSSGKAVLAWDGFSIGQGGAVRIENGAGATLNRVTGSSVSSIDGLLSASGSVYLINPNGVVIGKGGVVNTGGTFVASSLDVADASFLGGGDLAFAGPSRAAVINLGKVGALGGDVALIARTVSNGGSITAANGAAGLLAGSDVLLRDAALDDGKFVVRAGGADTSATNAGSIAAAAAELRANGGNVYALAGDTAGVIRATGVTMRDGRIWLTAGDSGTTSIAGALVARAADGAGGTIVATAGTVALADGALLDASGTDGGTVLVGGDRAGGADPSIRLAAAPIDVARVTSVAQGTRILADGTAGGGGNVIVWSDGKTDFSGAISARGVTAGGFAEVSSRGVLGFRGAVDLSSVAGAPGTLLLDPENVTIAESATTNANYAGGVFTPTGDNSVISVTDLQQALATANVVVTTGGSGSRGAQAGDLAVDALAITWSSRNGLTLSAYRDIALNGVINATGGGAVTLRADNSGNGTGTVTFASTARIATTGQTAIIYNPTSYAAATNFAGNVSGPLQTYMLVNNLAQLQLVATNRAGSYAINRDIDASASAAMNGGAGFAPIGDGTNPFTGLLDGFGHTVSGLTINRPTSDLVGLFGLVGAGGTVKNLTLSAASITGQTAVGTLAGTSFGTASNISTSGSLQAAQYAGGLVGLSYGTIANVVANVVVQASGDNAGGLAGSNHGTVIGSIASGGVTGANYIGGVTGWSNGSILNSTANGAVTGADDVGGIVGSNVAGPLTSDSSTGNITGRNFVGGLAGYNVGALTNASASGNVTGSGGAVGGLVGLNTASQFSTGTIGTATASGAVTGGYNVGGLVGFNTATVSGVSATGAVSSAGDNAGGLIGFNTAIISGASAAGNVSSMGNDVGGLIGSNAGAISNASASGSVSGGYYVGGLLGTSTGAASNVSATGTVSATGDNVGGLIGSNGGALGNASATGRVTGGAYVGGLVGANTASATGVSASGNVTAKGDNVGGLIGSNAGIITNAVANGDVSGGSYVGGLIGASTAAANSVSATGGVAGSGDDIGGLIGASAGAISNATAAGNVSGGYFVGGLVGATTAAGSIAAGTASGAATGSNYVGGLVGFNSAAVTTGRASGAASASGATAGGLIGFNTGAVARSLATGAVSGAAAVGGLVGSNHGVLSDVEAQGAVTANASAAGGAGDFGGLVGYTSADITRAYAIGAVSGTQNVGGLVGLNDGGRITQTYATGAVAGSGINVGALVGANLNYLGDSYFDAGTTGQTAAAGLDGSVVYNVTAIGGGTGISPYARSTYASFAFGPNWVIFDGSTRPFLASEASSTITNAHQLQLVAINLGGAYTLANDIDLGELSNPSGLWNPVTGFVPIGASQSQYFTGSLNGSGHTISGLLIKRPTTDYVGLFGATSAVISNLALNGGTVVGRNFVGSLAGYTSGGSVTSAHTSVNVSGSSNVGGLIGLNGSNVNRSYATGTVTGTNALSSYVGGLIGYNNASYYASVSNSFATGQVSGYSQVGGLVGYNFGYLGNSYATGSVTGTLRVGGLVGENQFSLGQSYATGAVTGSAYVGGLIGYDAGYVSGTYASGRVTFVPTSAYTSDTLVGGLIGYYVYITGSGLFNNYWDVGAAGTMRGIGSGQVSGLNPVGIGGATGRDPFQAATYQGFDFTNVWTIDPGKSRPMLRGTP